MNVMNCKKCGRIFNYASGQVVCSECKKELEIKFKDTRIFIRRNPQSSIQTVSEECEIDVKQIKQWIREERLSFSKDSDVGIECEKCGTNIKTGRFCDVCKADTLNDLNSVRRPQNGAPINRVPERDNRSKGMHFMNKDR